MKRSIVTTITTVAMLLTCNVASAADVAIYVWSGANSENILSLFRAVEAMGHAPHGIGEYDITRGRLSNFDVLILPAGENGVPDYYHDAFTSTMKSKVETFVSTWKGFVRKAATPSSWSTWSGGISTALPMRTIFNSGR